MIRASNLVKGYPTASGFLPVVDGLSLEVEAGAWVTLLGPSGCGKTTTLRMIAGLETPDSGDIWIKSRHVFSDAERLNVRTHRRSIGMVFQSYALWPHLNVAENVGFPLRMQAGRLKKSDMKSRISNMLQLVDLSGMEERRISALSGGQQQRVALARALVSNPDVLLLDEPLSNLDSTLRSQMCSELRRLQRETGVTTVFVTHDQNEALAMSDHILLMAEGKCVQAGTPQDLFETPSTSFVAEFMGFSNRLPATLLNIQSGMGEFETELGRVLATLPLPLDVGGAAELLFRPEAFTGSLNASSPRFRGRILSRLYQGVFTDYTLQLASGQTLAARLPTVDANTETETSVLEFALDPARVIAVGALNFEKSYDSERRMA